MGNYQEIFKIDTDKIKIFKNQVDKIFFGRNNLTVVNTWSTNMTEELISLFTFRSRPNIGTDESAA